MKCLIKTFAQFDKGVLFIEQCVSGKRHGIIECIPLPYDQFEQAPAFFKVLFEWFSISIMYL